MTPKHCLHHLANIVTNSAGAPTCRSCGVSPTPEQEAEGIPALEAWRDAQSRAKPRRSR